jgi:signal transduction histidine kinase
MDENKNNKAREKDLLQVLSHQLKSPLNTLQSFFKTINQVFTGVFSPQTL